MRHPPGVGTLALNGIEPSLLEDSRFVRQHGLWVFTGAPDPGAIPDHRDIQEERIDSFVKAALGEGRDGDVRAGKLTR